MVWNVEATEEYALWYAGVESNAQADIDAVVLMLSEKGPQLSRPHADTLKGSIHSNMKELRVQSGGKPLRICFAFDPNRSAILLIGGDKTGDKRFYDRMISQADSLYEEHLEELKKRGRK